MKRVLLLLLSLSGVSGGAQATVVMTHDHIGSAGLQANAGTIQLSGSLGGSPFATLTAPGTMILQGFWFPTPSVSDAEGLSGPIAFALGRNAPNPFSPTTIIPYAVAAQGGAGVATRMEIYDVDGRLVSRLVEGELPAGVYRAEWGGCDTQGRPVAAGIYYCRLRSGRHEATRALVLLR